MALPPQIFLQAYLKHKRGWEGVASFLQHFAAVPSTALLLAISFRLLVCFFNPVHCHTAGSLRSIYFRLLSCLSTCIVLLSYCFILGFSKQTSCIGVYVNVKCDLGDSKVCKHTSWQVHLSKVPKNVSRTKLYTL